MRIRPFEIILYLVAGAAIVIVVFMYGVYFLEWQGRAVRGFSKIVPLPAARVNENYILLRNLSDMETLDELIERELIRQMGKSYGAFSREELGIVLVQRQPSEKIRKARTAVSLGADFAEVAAENSEDEESRYIGGDLGFLVIEQLPGWMRAAVAPLEVGQMSEVVAGPDGFHVYQATARDNESNPPRKQIRQIFVKIDSGVHELIEQKIETSKIYVFVRN
ncbi:MAG: peptidylprolyl isomerase [Candidatus Doudnabacteria bacterium]|nr:peptidylprolyl isomerase [Candidatus Doudnabacteria bacterium]